MRLLALLALGIAYVSLLRRSILMWGATEEEAASGLPGDELLPDADGVATRAITIDAPAAAVWPWIAQMGPTPRGGAYTYDWIENLLGLNMHSVDRVLDDFQRPRLGDAIGLGANKMRVERVEPQRVLAWRSEDRNWVWTFVLAEREGHTRLISRNRFRLPSIAARAAMLAMEPASLLMERKMLRGIKWRSERLAASGSRVQADRTQPSAVAPVTDSLTPDSRVAEARVDLIPPGGSRCASPAGNGGPRRARNRTRRRR